MGKHIKDLPTRQDKRVDTHPNPLRNNEQGNEIVNENEHARECKFKHKRKNTEMKSQTQLEANIA